MRSVIIKGLNGSETDIDLITSALGQKDIKELNKFYDRNPSIHSWYYQCYGQEPCGTEKTPDPNSVAHSLQIRGSFQNVIIVKNGPSGGKWMEELVETVARTIWWYIKSGNDRAQVFGEREFARFLMDL